MIQSAKSLGSSASSWRRAASSFRAGITIATFSVFINIHLLTTMDDHQYLGGYSYSIHVLIMEVFTTIHGCPSPMWLCYSNVALLALRGRPQGLASVGFV